MNNYNTNNKVIDMEKILNTPKLVIKKKFEDKIVYFTECSREEAKNMIIKNHYSHKFMSSFGRINIGIYHNGRLLGVASFGNLMNPESYKNFGDFTKENIIELNRMWINEELGKNIETMLLSASIKIIKTLYPYVKLIQSFADGRLGCGIMYQAANFKYYGEHNTIFLKNVITNEINHKINIENITNIKCVELAIDYLSGNIQVVQVKTYRYIYNIYNDILCKLQEYEYPKNEGSELYVESYEKINENLRNIYTRFIPKSNKEYKLFTKFCKLYNLS